MYALLVGIVVCCSYLDRIFAGLTAARSVGGAAGVGVCGEGQEYLVTPPLSVLGAGCWLFSKQDLHAIATIYRVSLSHGTFGSSSGFSQWSNLRLRSVRV